MRYPYLMAMWRYARGMAFANLNQLTNARNELQMLNDIQDGADFEDFLIFGINSGQVVVDIAMNVLEAEIAQKKLDFITAEKLLLNAMVIEDSMSYNEPPDWFFSVRHLLGELYMKQDLFVKAQLIYEDDLKNFPRNGFALNGLYQSLAAQNKNTEARKMRHQYEIAWSFSDTKLLFSRVDEAYRKDLVIDVTNNSSPEIMRIAASFCGF